MRPTLVAALLAVAIAGAPAAAAPPAAFGLAGPAFDTGDLTRALRFWRDGIGLTVARELGSASRRETILTFGDDPAQAAILLMSGPGVASPAGRGGSFDRLVVRVPDLAATAARLTAAGFPTGPLPAAAAGGHRVLHVEGPDGVRVELVERPARP